jgi:hypothetical protein
LVWLGSFHTNTVEGVWSKIKRLTHNFTGLNGNIIHKLEEKGINIMDYFNDWICTAIFF